MPDVKMFSQAMFMELDAPLTFGSVTLPKGTIVQIIPKTTAHCVSVPGGKTLQEAWPDLVKKDDLKDLPAGLPEGGVPGQILTIANEGNAGWKTLGTISESDLHTGATEPDDSLGKDGDFYIQIV